MLILAAGGKSLGQLLRTEDAHVRGMQGISNQF